MKVSISEKDPSRPLPEERSLLRKADLSVSPTFFYRDGDWHQYRTLPSDNLQRHRSTQSMVSGPAELDGMQSDVELEVRERDVELGTSNTGEMSTENENESDIVDPEG